MTWHSNSTWQTAKLKANILTNIRVFFANRDVVEVDTPLLSHGTVTDVHLDAFVTHFSHGENTDSNTDQKLFLQTSPEFLMKRLLASGYGCCYQICKAFRNEQAGRNHNPEFTLLEWYRIGFTHLELMDELADLLKCILGCGGPSKLTYQDAFIQHLSVDPLNTCLLDLKAILASKHITGDWIETEQDLDILLQVIFSECIEPLIGQESPCFIYNFPRNQASLAKISRKDSRVAERFECYYKGVELANGFNELTEPKEQLARFDADNAKRNELNKMTQPVDKRFICALESGLPDCSGVALGIDRLLMLALDENSIKSVMSFSTENA
jgi:lysyl-tRNA synthetase class 2